MNRPRIALGLESSRASLNADACAALGRALLEARQSQALDVRGIASRLLLSTAQVNGLERADSDAFYSAQLYLVAARKYDALLGLSSPLVDQLLVRAADTSQPETQKASSPAASHESRRLLRPLAAAAMVAMVSLAVGGWLVLEGWPVSVSTDADRDAAVFDRQSPAPTMDHLVADHHPFAPMEVRLSAPAAVPAPSAAASRAAAGSIGHIRVPHSTWVFVRYVDNSVVERVIGPADTFVLRDVPVYVAVGAASGAEVVLEGHRIDTTRFNVNGQLRIGSAFLSAAAR